MASQRDQPRPPSELSRPHDTPWQVVHRLTLAPRVSRSHTLRSLMARFLFPAARRPGWKGYVAAVLGVALVSGCIALIQLFVHIANISLLYLLVVLWLATVFGRGPALLASVLAFLAFDFFFISPRYRLTVDDPTEWLSLCAFLITALVLGQLTALVQARAHEARESQQRTDILYALAQLIASTTDQQALLEALARRVLAVFTPAGVRACALFLPDENKRPIMRAAADGPLVSTTFNLEHREQAALAGWVLTHGSPVGCTLPHEQGTLPEEATLTYVPLQSGQQVVGVLGMVGTPDTRR
ncbi:MAG TPA: DUF4118 domain-containing protein, partial [Ktedonobacterales bacterium]|nr:DUF4118 domain-containing protein [Ktedonobacterales bacterium]